MSEVIRNDIFRFTSTKSVPMGFYRLCKEKPVNPQFWLPNLLVTADQPANAVQPYFESYVVSRQLYESIEDGDVGIINNGNMMRVLLSRRANHNTVLVTERCNNKCLFCSQPPKAANDDWLLMQSALAIAAFDFEGVIGVSGGEPLLYGEEFLTFLDFVAENAPQTSLHVLTNGRGFSDTRFSKSVKERTKNMKITFGIPLYSSHASIHDQLVGSLGAFNDTVAGIINAGNLGINIELRFIPTRLNINELPELVEFTSRVFSNVNQISIMGLESTGWARKNWEHISIDNYKDTEIFNSADRISQLSGVPLTFFNYPLCQLPKNLWSFAVQSISDWKNYYPEECYECTMKTSCAGYFSSSKGKFHQTPRPIL
ncbi:His-Xaa-Ser system radical SAM maturase HxsC [Phytobacter sp. RSE-02]|uniref:His-Xaa-Ser system radical SAM maturase HxsC n=1 Tax=Phytobacter sp. RSE-02 TaxID=3229229 RepID=UPI00339D5F65